MIQDRLSNLAIWTIERDVAKDFDNIELTDISDLAAAKANEICL